MDKHAKRTAADLLKERILVLDGAMGTLIQRYELDEAGFRGDRFKDHPHDLRGANDLLNLTRPDVIGEIHDQYLDAGADIISTNTFNANAISMADYALEPYAEELNRAAASIARAAADAATAADARQAALRRRLARADQQDRVALARRQRSRRAQRHLGPAGRRIRRGGARPRRRRRRHPADRDDLRHAQRQGGDLRRRVAASMSSASACR